jgi:hypothetical protein
VLEAVSIVLLVSSILCSQHWQFLDLSYPFLSESWEKNRFPVPHSSPYQLSSKKRKPLDILTDGSFAFIGEPSVRRICPRVPTSRIIVIIVILEVGFFALFFHSSRKDEGKERPFLSKTKREKERILSSLNPFTTEFS